MLFRSAQNHRQGAGRHGHHPEDSDYRGEIKIPLINWGKQEFLISDGDRIAQLVISKYERITLEDIGEGELAGSERGSGGFGHTGV